MFVVKVFKIDSHAAPTVERSSEYYERFDATLVAGIEAKNLRRGNKNSEIVEDSIVYFVYLNETGLLSASSRAGFKPFYMVMVVDTTTGYAIELPELVLTERDVKDGIGR